MWQDPVVNEIRELRKQYAEKFDNDMDKIFADLEKRQSESSERLVALPSKKPVLKEKIA
jgi:hypothetical protein